MTEQEHLELDAEVAGILGWKQEGFRAWRDSSGILWTPPPSFSQHIAPAWEVVKKMREAGCTVQVRLFAEDGAECMVVSTEDRLAWNNESECVAICMAALEWSRRKGREKG